MPKKQPKRARTSKLTPEVLQQLDQEALVSLILKLYEQNVQLSEQLQAFVHEKYGRKTERFEDPNQLRIMGNTADNADAGEEPKKEKPAKKPGHTRNPMPSHLERKRLDRQPTHEERNCSCGGQRIKVNEVIRNSRFECIPVTLFVEDIIDSVWECARCHSAIVVEAQVCEPIINGIAGPGLQVKIAEDRWLNHLPLHRQEQMFFRHGIHISRSTMCGWMAALAERFRGVYDAMRADLLKSKVIATDDTPVKVLDRTKKRNIKRGHEWICIGDNEHPVNVFHYTEGRGRDGPKTFMPGFTGYLQGDCFSGNRALCAETGAKFVACLAHARRYFKKALPNDEARANEALRMFRQLFKTESEARDFQLSPEDTKRMRQQESLPVLLELKAWLDEQVVATVPKSSLGKAIAYCLNNWDVLNNYLLDGDLRIDNNLSEQQMKKIAIGRKNWLFFGSDEGGEHASILLSLLSTAVRHDLKPAEYLHDVLVRLTEDPTCDVQSLIPHRWRQEREKGGIEGVKPTPQMLSL